MYGEEEIEEIEAEEVAIETEEKTLDYEPYVPKPTIDPNCFCVKSAEGVSINGIKFSKGDYKIGQLVGTLTIDKDLMNSILSADIMSIRSNSHSE